jgi:secondary thiamine-phosphate synthase enzyme
MMKSYTEYLVFNTAKPREVINITRQLEQCLAKSGIKEGLMLVNPMHITASVYINDAEPGLYLDIEELLEKLAPAGRPYHHHHTGEDNGDAHLKRQLLGQQVTLPITQGRFDFGPWEQVHYFEFDGQRKKRVLVKAIGE